MRAILMFHWISRKWWTKSQDSVNKPQPFWSERRAEAVLNQGPSAYQPDALPLCQTSSCIIKGELNYLFETRKQEIVMGPVDRKFYDSELEVQ